MPRLARLDAPGILHHIIIRSLGGWAASKKLRLKGQDRLKGDERILGDSDFVALFDGKIAALSDEFSRMSRGHLDKFSEDEVGSMIEALIQNKFDKKSER